MIAINIEMPKNCVECNRIGLQQIIDCQLIYSGCANCGRHPNCPLKEIVTCKDCKHRIEATCLKHNCFAYASFYCKDGERRE